MKAFLIGSFVLCASLLSAGEAQANFCSDTAATIERQTQYAELFFSLGLTDLGNSSNYSASVYMSQWMESCM